MRAIATLDRKFVTWELLWSPSLPHIFKEVTWRLRCREVWKSRGQRANGWVWARGRAGAGAGARGSQQKHPASPLSVDGVVWLASTWCAWALSERVVHRRAVYLRFTVYRFRVVALPWQLLTVHLLPSEISWSNVTVNAWSNDIYTKTCTCSLM